MSASGTISTLVWGLIVIIVVIILVFVLFKLLALLFVLPEVYAVQNGTAPPAITTFRGTETPITSSLQFIPQQAWVQTIPPAGVQLQSSSVNNDNDLESTIIPILVSAGGIIAAKFTSDKKAAENHKSNAAEILKNKENVKELARVTYDMNPEAAAKIDDAPSVKIQTLTQDVQAYAQKVAEI